MTEVNPTFKVPLYPITPILGLISCFGLLFYLKTNAITHIQEVMSLPN
jgi:hypothetical protein